MKITLPKGDWEGLGNQPVNRTALQRSRFVHLPGGQMESKHAHPTSDQILLITEGLVRLETGQQRLGVRAGHLVWLPRQCIHQLTAGESGCRFWEVIGPNREPHRISRGFPVESQRVEAAVHELTTDLVLRGSPDLRVDVLRLPSRSTTSRQTLHEQERLWYVLSGSALATVRTLSGEIGPHTILVDAPTKPRRNPSPNIMAAAPISNAGTPAQSDETT